MNDKDSQFPMTVKYVKLYSVRDIIKMKVHNPNKK